MNIRYEWKDNIDFIINPQDEYYLSFFTKKWDRKMTEKIFSPQSFISDLWCTIKAGFYLLFSQLKVRMQRHHPITIGEYMEMKKISS
jgi:Ni,Fe-hydrogenase I cytochrome b subunit